MDRTRFKGWAASMKSARKDLNGQVVWYIGQINGYDWVKDMDGRVFVWSFELLEFSSLDN